MCLSSNPYEEAVISRQDEKCGRIKLVVNAVRIGNLFLAFCNHSEVCTTLSVVMRRPTTATNREVSMNTRSTDVYRLGPQDVYNQRHL